MDAGSRTDSFDALLVELVGELDATHPALSDLGRFEVTATLGQGGFGSVYAATDTRDGREVALKVLRRGSADALLRFKREFRSLADVRHRNLVQLHELLQVGDKWLLSMERVEGEPFDVYVARHPEQLRAVLSQLVEGVAALHEAGKLHRDLKPSNVLVEEGGRVVILDFGLVRERADDGSTVLAGTPAYMSPEQCAEQELGPASDWYAVGVMHYQALSGRLPFEGTMVELLRRKQSEEPPPLEVGEAHRELGVLAMRLLAREPKARPSGEALLRELGAEEEAPATSRGRASTGEVFVGREEELAQLHAALAKVKEGTPRSVYVHGVSGMGKSALVARFAEQARAAGALVLMGRCYERETVPFKAVDGLVDSLCLHLRRLSPRRAAAVLPRGIHAAAKLFPVLNAVDALSDIPKQKEVDDGPEQRRRGFVALKELVGALADGRPLVVVIDDLQWGDEDSARLLAELLGPPGNPSMLFVGAFRREERAQSVLLRELGRTFEVDEELGVDALSEEAATRLAAALLETRGGQSASDSDSGSGSGSESGSGSASARAARLAAESEGHPLFLRQLVEHEADDEDDGRPPSLGSVLRARLARLPTAHRATLELVALAGRPTAQPVVAEATGQTQIELTDIADALERDAWLRSSGQGRSVECFHDRIRETVVAQLPEADRRALHRRLADAMVAADGAPDAIAESYLAAGAETEAATFAVRAAERAEGMLAFEQAVRWYRQALRLESHGEHVLGRQRRLAEALSSAGRGAEAARVFLEVAASTPGLEGLRLRQRAALAYLGAGHWDDGLDVLRPLLAELGRPMPATTAGMVARTAWAAAKLRLVTTEKEGPVAQPTEEDALCFEALFQAARALVSANVVVCVYLASDAALLGLESGTSLMILEGVATLIGLTAPGGPRSERWCAKVVNTTRRLEPGYQRVRLATVEGDFAIVRGDWASAFAVYDRCLAELDGQAPERHDHRDYLQQLRVYALQKMGRLRELEVYDERRLRHALELGRPFPAMMSQLMRAFVAVSRGETRAARELLGVIAAQEPLATVQLFSAGYGCCIALYGDDAPEAREAVRRIHRHQLHLELIPIWFADQGAYEPRAQLAFWEGDRATIRKVERRAKRIAGKKVLFAPAVAASLLAGVAARRKRFAQAADLFEEAARGFDDNHMKLDAAACRLRQGEILGGDRGRALVEAAEAVFREEDVAEPERFAHAMYTPRFPLR